MSDKNKDKARGKKSKSVETSEHRVLKQMRRLSHALIISMGLNIGLVAAFSYWIIRDKYPSLSNYEKRPIDIQLQASLADERSNDDVIRLFKVLPLEQLVAKLESSQLVENGFSQRDLALGSLVTFHHFDLARALSGLPQMPPYRALSYKTEAGQINEIIVYSQLSDEHFKTIINFANTERWPLTNEGLFLALKTPLLKQQQSLADTFYLTYPFTSLEMLFSRADAPVTKHELLSLILDGEWSMLFDFSEQQRAAQDLSPARRQLFLLDYIDKKSKSAANLLLKTDYAFATKKLDDQHILTMLQILEDNSEMVKNFTIDLIMSPRNDNVRQMAAARLEKFRNNTKPLSYKKEAIASYAPQSLPPEKKREAAPAVITKASRKPQAPSIKAIAKPVAINKPVAKSPAGKSPKTYVVQQGDSLWKIAKQHKVDVDKLKAYNNLQSDKLKLGTTLKIPS